MELLEAIVAVSEKAANIARVCREDKYLFDLLVQKKKDDESNPRFVEDFKTLADVLIQEMVKYDLKNQFFELSNNIKGEENNVFTNKLGEKISVEIKPNNEETALLLETVLHGDKIAAKLLATEVHREVNTKGTVKIPQQDFQIDLEELGIWIDPIDCTAEYIHGDSGESDGNINIKGLKCVTILIGVFHRMSGIPIMGVINCPFHEDNNELYEKCIWGISLPNCKYSNISPSLLRKNIICISASESEEIKEKLRHHGFYLVEASGAGYKILTVILGLADAYLLTRGTTYKWDTCSPHSILKSMDGDILDFRKTMEGDEKSIEYSPEGTTCNTNGIIAYRNRDIVEKIISILK